MEVAILYFAGCPAYRRARERTLAAALELGVKAPLTMTLVRNARDARDLDFHGSPTVRIDGRDIDPEGLARHPDVGLLSRSYRWKKNEYDCPPLEMLREALRAAPRAPPGEAF